MSRYKFFWHGCNAGVGFLVSDSWMDRIVDVKE